MIQKYTLQCYHSICNNFIILKLHFKFLVQYISCLFRTIFFNFQRAERTRTRWRCFVFLEGRLSMLCLFQLRLRINSSFLRYPKLGILNNTTGFQSIPLLLGVFHNKKCRLMKLQQRRFTEKRK